MKCRKFAKRIIYAGSSAIGRATRLLLPTSDFRLNSQRHPGLHDINGREFVLLDATDGSSRDHCTVVCTQAAVRDAKTDALLVAVILQAGAQPAVRTHATAHHERLHLGLLEGIDGL